MENWHLFTAAFVLSLVDLSVLGAFLWYQFSTLYFAWHLCPMIVNRICELIAFMFTGGMLPSLFAIVQVPLSLFSTTIYANRQQRLQNKLLLAVYCTLLVYEFLVAVLMIKMGRYLKYPSSLGSNQSRSSLGQQAPQPYIAFHMFALFTQPLGSSCPYVRNPERHQDSHLDGFVTVQQPDGKKVMLGKVLQSKFESPVKAEVEGTGGGKDGDVSIIITPLTVPSEREHEISCNQLSTLPSQAGEGPFALASAESAHFDHATSCSQSTALSPGTVCCNREMPLSALPVDISVGSEPAAESGCCECETASSQSQASASETNLRFQSKAHLPALPLEVDRREASLCEMA